MLKSSNNSVLQYLLILCLSLALLLAQSNRLHMHLEHDDHSSIESGHVVNVHIASLLHDIDLANHQDDHHLMAIDISSANIVKKISLFNPLAIILLLVTLFLLLPCRALISRQRLYKILRTPVDYLLYPPLRAPPIA